MVSNKSPANELTGQILDFLFKNGCFAWRQQSTGLFDKSIANYRSSPKKGVADILGCYKGKFIAIEVKIGKDKLSDEQIGFGKNIEYCGGLWCVARNFEEFKTWWGKIGLDNKI